MDFFDLKGIVEALAQRLHLEETTYTPVQTPELHPGQSAEITRSKIKLGVLGQLHPTLLSSYDLGRRKVYVADLDLDALLAVTPNLHRFSAISTFPPVLEDIALVVEESLPATKVEAEIRAGGGELLRRIRLFDVYRGANLPAGKKSLAYALTYQAEDRSLTDKEVSKVRAKIIGRVEKLLGATLRA
jgi:phenylalanyl-tRNA synthetase beta chain